MSLKLIFACILILSAAAVAQITGDVIGMHDLSPGSSSPITGARPGSCTYCHAPHSGLSSGKALWNQTLSIQMYSNFYTSSSYHQQGAQPILGSDSNLCLSCHDGTVAVGQTLVSGKITTTGAMSANDVFKDNLQSSHPISVVTPIQDAPSLVQTLSSGQTADPTGAVKLINGNIECTSCHNPHVQAKDPTAKFFLVKDSSNGGMCLSCHDPNRVVQGQTNPLAGWANSVHASNGATVQNLPYPTLSSNACFSCHTDHNAAGASWLLRGAGDQVCLNCHSGGMSGAVTLAAANPFMRSVSATPNLVGPAKAMASINIASEYAKIGHPISTGQVQARAQSTLHRDAVTATPNASTESGCIDCHEPHAIGSGGSANVVLAPAVRASQKSVWGVSEKDGVTIVRPAQYQYQTCLRCHGPSARAAAKASKYGYQPVRLALTGDPNNLIPQFGATAGSSHPVFHPRTSSLPQPSLLSNMINLDGTTQGRPMGSQIYCTDCHNSDDNREFGGTGPTGPHGSKWGHILERRYEMSQAINPGQAITNLFPSPDLTTNGPYALCAKCHNLSNIMQNTSFSQHAQHIRAGFSCSTCHTAHGVANSTANASGQRLISFDSNVVGSNAGMPITYNQGPATCTLTCHNTVHNPNGTVTTVNSSFGVKR